jgi:hypothetical protein
MIEEPERALRESRLWIIAVRSIASLFGAFAAWLAVLLNPRPA